MWRGQDEDKTKIGRGKDEDKTRIRRGSDEVTRHLCTVRRGNVLCKAVQRVGYKHTHAHAHAHTHTLAS